MRRIDRHQFKNASAQSMFPPCYMRSCNGHPCEVTGLSGGRTFFGIGIVGQQILLVKRDFGGFSQAFCSECLVHVIACAVLSVVGGGGGRGGRGGRGRGRRRGLLFLFSFHRLCFGRPNGSLHTFTFGTLSDEGLLCLQFQCIVFGLIVVGLVVPVPVAFPVFSVELLKVLHRRHVVFHRGVPFALPIGWIETLAKLTFSHPPTLCATCVLDPSPPRWLLHEKC